MLISRRHDGLWLVSQPEHARLAGQLAQAWGNERFPLGPDRASLTIAAARHDDGWTEIDAAPAISAEEGRPAHFLEVPPDESVGPYGEGVERIYEDDAYAGTLASMHWAGLYMSRWGVQESPPAGRPLLLEVVEAQGQRVEREVRELWAQRSGLRSVLEAELWRDYELLQAFDLISLALCLIDTRTPTPEDAEMVPVPGTLRPIVQPGGGRQVPLVPAAGGTHLALCLRVIDPDVIEFDPFPFETSGAVVEFTARRMTDARHPTVEAAAAAYHDAELVKVNLTIVSPAR